MQHLTDFGECPYCRGRHLRFMAGAVYGWPDRWRCRACGKECLPPDVPQGLSAIDTLVCGAMSVGAVALLIVILVVIAR